MITIVGLGPGDGRYLTREAWQLLLSAEAPVLLRTAEHPAVKDLPCAWHGFDELYAAHDDFESVYRQIVAEVVAAGQDGDVVYAVPGDPHVGEATTAAIQAAATVPVRIVRGLSFIEPTLAVLEVDALEGIQIYDALVVSAHLHPPLNTEAPLLIAQLYSRLLAGELKLALMALYPPEHPVRLIHGAGSDDALIETVQLFEIDRSDNLGNMTTLYVPARPAHSLARLADTLAILRSPDGCPWDQEQTPQSLRRELLEEAVEVLDALDRDDVDDVREELGDLLFHIVMQAQMGSEAGDFTIYDVLGEIIRKIVRRHPHVWGDETVNTLDDLHRTWERIKREEKGEPAAKSILTNIPTALPALARSQKIQRRVAKVGFEWEQISDVYSKLEEELHELQAAETDEQRKDELGDVLFVVVNLAKQLGIDAETALREANLKFMGRFMHVEQLAALQGTELQLMSLQAMEALWQRSKLETE